MIRTETFCARVSIDQETLELWTASRWIMADDEQGEAAYSEADEARGRFIHSLQHDMGVNEAGIDLILQLVDQIHGLRGTMQALVEGLAEQPEEVRRAVLLRER